MSSEDQFADRLVLEGLAITTNDDGSPNVSPMGPLVDRALTTFLLKPFTTSQTFRNVQRGSGCVFNVTDDVVLLAQTAVGALPTLPRLESTPSGKGWYLADGCRWFELQIERLDLKEPRVDIYASVADKGTLRDFFGWNRAKHAVLEAAILATRVHILPSQEIREQLDRLTIWVDKTGGRQERDAIDFLQQYFRHELPPE
jgi:uncharacterized protein